MEFFTILENGFKIKNYQLIEDMSGTLYMVKDDKTFVVELKSFGPDTTPENVITPPPTPVKKSKQCRICESDMKTTIFKTNVCGCSYHTRCLRVNKSETKCKCGILYEKDILDVIHKKRKIKKIVKLEEPDDSSVDSALVREMDVFQEPEVESEGLQKARELAEMFENE